MEWGAAITVVLSLILWGVKQWAGGAPARKKEAEDAAIQTGRNDIATGNIDRVNERADGLLSQATDRPSGQHSDSDIARRLNDLLKS